MGILLQTEEQLMSVMEEYMAMMSTMSIISDLISLAISIFMIVVVWKINVKAGEPGWACLIPFYSSWVDCKVAKKKWLFVPQLITGIVMVISLFTAMIGVAMSFATMLDTSVSYGSGLMIGSIIVFIISVIASIVFNVIYSIGLANAFGQGTGFVLGLIFLPNIFKAIIAFSGNIQYIPDNDYVMNQSNAMYSGPEVQHESRLNENNSDWNSSTFN